MVNQSVTADMKRAFSRCPACARQQLQIENGQYVPGNEVKGELLSTPRGGGSSRRARAAASASAAAGGGGGRSNALAQHEIRPEVVICNHCLCSREDHEDTGPNGQRCCGGVREGPWDRVCELCKLSEDCRAWKNRPCPIALKAIAAEAEAASAAAAAATATATASAVSEAAVSEAASAAVANGAAGTSECGSSSGTGSAAGGGSGSSNGSALAGEKRCKTGESEEEPCKTDGRNFCRCCTCPCAKDNPHKFDDSSWVSKNAEVQRACRMCLSCWAGWCMVPGTKRRRLVGATLEPEEPFARQWRPGRDADVYVLTGLFDEMTGRLPEGSFAHAVFGDSLRYFKGFAGSLDAKHALCEAGVVPGSRSGAIGEAWSGGGSMYPPERPAGARKVVAAPLRQGEGANRHFSRQHGRRDHNWQWDMLKSPWALKLMEKGRLALDVSEEEADEFEEAGIIAFPGHVVKHKDSVKNGGYGKTIGTLVLKSPESAFVCVQVQGSRLGKAVEAAEEMGIELPPKFEQRGRFKFAINELDAWAMVGGAARNDAEHAVVCGRTAIPRGEPGEGFVRVAFNMRWGWQDDPRV